MRSAPRACERDHRAITSPHTAPDIQARPPARIRSYWSVGRILRYLASLVLSVVAINIVLGKRDELSGATSYLENLRWYWVVVAAAVEALSIVAFAAMQRRLLRAGHVSIPMTTLTGITFAGNAIQNSLPAGPLFSAVFAYRQFHRRGADDILAGWTLVGTAALSQISIVILAMIGLAGASGTGSAFDLVGVLVGLLAIAAVLILIWNRRSWILGHTVGPLRLVQRLFHRPEGDPHQLVADVICRTNAIDPTKSDWVMLWAMAMANWLLDVCCLIAAFFAVGAGVPWRALLLAYAASQLAASLPITPGGLGVVEGSLIIGLVAYGGGQEATVAAVLLYRLLSFWALLPIGYVSWALVDWELRRRDNRAGDLA
ncbi:MAG: flippase-like domain-containing protein [Actinomycetota bacterium]|nr:flippase-like domain-containing protein [Actinomycetota bacterium]